MPPSQLVGRIALIDVRAKVAANPDYAVTVADVDAWEAKHGRLTDRHVVFVLTGWSDRWPDMTRYRNVGADGKMHFPGVSIEAARMLLSRGVRALGIDTLSTDPGSSSTFEQHNAFHAAGGINVENLANLAALPEAGAIAIIAPLPFENGSGSPARVLAVVP